MADPATKEVELKLAATGEAMDTLIASQLLRGHASSTVRSRNLVTTYFDTEDRRLGRRHLALRVRQTGKKFIQTLKTASSESSVETSRGEWEVELPDDTPLLTAFNDATVLDLVGLVLPDELQPTFQTRFRRQAVLVEWPDANRQPALIEVAFDRGAIRADGGEVPICEIELELKRGEPKALFELAQSMRTLVPVRLQPVDKAARGYALVTGAPPAWRKASAVCLAEGASVEDALQRILGACVRHWVDNEASAREARDPEGLHQLRVALRRSPLRAFIVQERLERAVPVRLERPAALAARASGAGARPRRARFRDPGRGRGQRAPTIRHWASWPSSWRTGAGRRTIPCARHWARSGMATWLWVSPAG